MQIGKGKQGVKIGEYTDLHDSNGPIGWIEPACDKSQWILFFTVRGDTLFYTKRGPNGGVIGEPIRVKARP